MLKLLAVMAALLIIIIGFSFFVYYENSAISGDLLDSLSGIKQHLEKEKWEKVHDEIKQLNSHWEKADRWWTPFMDHREVDMVGNSIDRVASLAKVRLKEEALVEVSSAMRLVKRILDREGFSLSNIF